MSTRSSEQPSEQLSERHSDRIAHAWRLMFQFLMRSAPQRLDILEKHGLTPNDSRALFSLDTTGRPMGTLAREWQCDPSTATWLVDRLERARLAERVQSPEDRRVKLVRVTKKGTRTKEKLMEGYYTPPVELNDLSARDLEELVRILSSLHQ